MGINRTRFHPNTRSLSSDTSLVTGHVCEAIVDPELLASRPSLDWSGHQATVTQGGCHQELVCRASDAV